MINLVFQYKACTTY